MEDYPVHYINEVAGVVLVHLPEDLQEKFSQDDIELILNVEEEYIIELLITLKTPGPIDVLINPKHQIQSMIRACLLKGLPVEEDELAEILRVKQRHFEEDEDEENRKRYNIIYN